MHNETAVTISALTIGIWLTNSNEFLKEKNQKLLILGKKYNEVDLSYNQVLENIKGMQDYAQNHPLD